MKELLIGGVLVFITVGFILGVYFMGYDNGAAMTVRKIECLKDLNE